MNHNLSVVIFVRINDNIALNLKFDARAGVSGKMFQLIAYIRYDRQICYAYFPMLVF
ncbi:hypothetical protein D3C84_774880 [compost metagenome]